MKHNHFPRHNLFIISAFMLIMQACSVEKFIPEDERLYSGASVEIIGDSLVKNQSELQALLEEVVRPTPNKKFLGMQPGLYYYYKNQDSTPGFINKWLYKQLGEEPVYKSDVETVQVEELLLNRLENKGFFYSRVVSDLIDDEKNKTSYAVYTVTVPSPYAMASYNLDTLPSPIYGAIKNSVASTKIKNGNSFNLSALKLERERIDSELKAKGYYNFNPGFLIFEADTNQYDNKQFDLFLKLKKDVPKEAITPYRISKINVYPNYDLSQDSLQTEIVRYNEKNYIREEEFFKPKFLDPFITLEEGQLYSPSTSKNTARRLSSIGTYKFVNIKYTEVASEANDSLRSLEATIQLSPLNKRAVRAELQAVTKSNNFAGPSLGLTFTNRNLFKGGETLNISTSVGYEIQIGGDNQSGNSSLSLALKNELIIPRFITPITINKNFFKYAIPKTKVSLGVEYLKRTQLYTLLSGTGQFGYIWNANRYITHEFNPLSVTYTRLSNTTEDFETILAENPFLQRSFEQQFISGGNYSFTYNGMVDAYKTHQFFLNSTLDFAGNSISLLSKDPEDISESTSKTFVGVEYAQFTKVDVDVRYHFNFGNGQKIATRLFAGYGYAYGNSEVLPYIKQYFSGGPYSVRAFKTRSLGPGTFTGDGDSFFDQTGNIRLEANIEYRFPIFGFLKGAVFADAGNIWLSKENPVLEGGTFSSNFINELGMGTGVGLRVDVQGFVIRFDLAAPFHDPGIEDESKRFDFRVDEPVLNFAIGYPF